jgi:type I restriction enzyme, S subunit
MKHKWSITKLGEVLTERRETPTDDDLASGRVRIIEKISFDSGRIQLRIGGSTKTGMILVRPGDLVMSGINAAKGAIAIYDANETAPVGATIHYGAYETNRQRADVRFLWWMLRSHLFQELLLEYVPGGIKTELKAKRLLAVPVPLPSLAEQRRVVARIEELAAQIHEARTLRHRAAEEAEALWERGASKIFDHATGSYPIRPLADLVTIRGGGTPSKSDPFYWEGKIPWITPKDMKRRELSDAIDHISERATQESAAKLLEPGAVLVVVRGMILAHTFPSAVLRAPATINQDMKALVPKKEILSEFLCALFWASNSRMLELVEKSTHDTRKFQTDKLLGTDIVVPPIPEQGRIVSELDALQAEMDALKRLQAETTVELDGLLPSILDKAFKGDL